MNEMSNHELVAPPTQAKRAAIYLRVASARPTAQGTIQAQRDACQRLARKLGVEIGWEYADAGRSGRSFDRPGLRRLLADLESELKVEYVLVDGVSHLSRSPLIHERVSAVLTRSGTTILSTEEAGGIVQNQALTALRLVIARAWDRDRKGAML
jgi:site-specific DNA recombinase